MVTILLSFVGLVASADAEVQTLDGKTFSGTIVTLNDKQLSLDGDENQVIPLEQLSSIKLPENSDTQTPPNVWVTLADGSTSPARSFSSKDGTSIIKLTDGAHVSVASELVKNVRFYPPSGALDPFFAA